MNELRIQSSYSINLFMSSALYILFEYSFAEVIEFSCQIMGTYFRRIDEFLQIKSEKKQVLLVNFNLE